MKFILDKNNVVVTYDEQIEDREDGFFVPKLNTVYSKTSFNLVEYNKPFEGVREGTHVLENGELVVNIAYRMSKENIDNLQRQLDENSILIADIIGGAV